MSKCRENPGNSKHSSGLQRPTTKRECACMKEYYQLKDNLIKLQAITRTHTQKQSKPGKSKNTILEKQKLGKLLISKPPGSCSETWFDVLRERSQKKTHKKVFYTGPTDICAQSVSQANLFKNIDTKGLTLLLDDEKFTKQLIQMNDLIESRNLDTHTSSRAHRDISITDDDKFKSYLETKLQEKSQEQKEKQNLQAKALVKLLQNMHLVSKNSEVQKETLNKLTQLIIQLREENNKMLNKFKEVRIDLESKLSDFGAENAFLKKQLRTVQKERNKAYELLDFKEKEIEMLKTHITTIKGKIANKIDSGIKYDLEDASFELDHLEDTLASVPSNNQSFEAPSRPASSSPAEEIMQKWKNRSLLFGGTEDDSGIQSNPRENYDSPNNNDQETRRKKQILSDLKNNVRKTVEQLESDMKFKDIYLNLSDATYKLSSSSAL